MANELKLRRGSSSSTAEFVGADGEVTIDQGRRGLVVHDGVTPGGFAVPTELEVEWVLRDFSALRSFRGKSTSIRLSGVGIGGGFARDDADLTSPDNGGTIIVDGLGRRWKRFLNGPLRVSMFGAIGIPGVDYTNELKSAHAVWCALVEAAPLAAGGPALIYDGGEYGITQFLRLPDASGWEIKTEGAVTLVQRSSNMGIFRMVASASRSGFKIKQGFRFRWVADQPVEQVESIAICFHANSDIPDGLWNFLIENPIVENGYRGVSPSIASITAGLDFPLWGFVIDRPSSGSKMSGALCAVGNFGRRGGAPQGRINKAYGNRLRASEPAVIWRRSASAVIDGFEINHSVCRAVSFESCTAVRFRNARFEFVSLPAGTDLITIAGSACEAEIDGLELQSVTADLSKSTDRCFALNAYQSRVRVRGLTVNGYSERQGRFFGYMPRGGGRIQHSGSLVRVGADGFLLYDSGVISEARSISYAGQQSVRFFRSEIVGGGPPLSLYAYPAVAQVVIDVDCYLVAVLVASSAPIVTGSLTVLAKKNGVPIPGFVVGPIGGGASGRKDAPIGFSAGEIGSNHRFAPGDTLALNVVATADFNKAAVDLSLSCVLAPD